ncbi:MAG: HNH endonuclease, partial [Candidatus Latescibacterota bacterium]
SALPANALAKLSDSQLIKHLELLVHNERQTTLNVLLHLIEMDRRSLYISRGYTFLFEYCTRHLGYSESAAMRRIKTARCIRDFPEIYEMLSKNELNLTTVAKLAEVLTKENKRELLREAMCKSARQIEAIIARHKPGSVIRDRVRTVYIKTLPSAEASAAKSDVDGTKDVAPYKACINNEKDLISTANSDQICTAGAGGKKPATGTSTTQQRKVFEQKYKLEFAVSPGFMKKLEEVKAILSKKHSSGISFEQMFELMLDEFLEKHSPNRRHLRRTKRTACKYVKMKHSPVPANNAARTANKAPNTAHNASHGRQRSRHIPAALQDQVFERDQGRCAFIGENGVRCNSTWNVQIDHIKPYARGGKHTIHNLRLLCARHNIHEAQRIYGREFLRGRIHKAITLRE